MDPYIKAFLNNYWGLLIFKSAMLALGSWLISSTRKAQKRGSITNTHNMGSTVLKKQNPRTFALVVALNYIYGATFVLIFLVLIFIG